MNREDVLIPGDGGEPRRLGRIEELQSFFSLGDESVPTTRRRRRDTPTGHHEPLSEQDLVKTKVRGSDTTDDSVTRSHPVDRDGEPLPTRSGKTLRPPRSDSGKLKVGEGPPPEPRTLPRAEGLPPEVRERLDSELNEPQPKRGTKIGRRAPEEVPPDRPTQVRRANPHASRHGQVDAIDAFNRAVRKEIGPSSIAEAEAAERESRSVDPEAATNIRGRQASIPDEPRPSDDDTFGDPEQAEAIVAAAIGPKPVSAKPASSGPISDDVRISDPPETPSPSASRPSVLRRSEVHSDPRFSGYSPRGKRPGLARWVAGIIGVGVIGVAGFTLVKRIGPGAEQVSTAAASDSRVDKFLQEGETRLAEGDIDGAKDHFNKASGVTESDPRVWRALARIAIVQADLSWPRAADVERRRDRSRNPGREAKERGRARSAGGGSGGGIVRRRPAYRESADRRAPP